MGSLQQPCRGSVSWSLITILSTPFWGAQLAFGRTNGNPFTLYSDLCQIATSGDLLAESMSCNTAWRPFHYASTRSHNGLSHLNRTSARLEKTHTRRKLGLCCVVCGYFFMMVIIIDDQHHRCSRGRAMEISANVHICSRCAAPYPGTLYYLSSGCCYYATMCVVCRIGVLLYSHSKLIQLCYCIIYVQPAV